MLLPTVGIEKIFNLPYTQEDFKIVYHRPVAMPVIPQAHKHDFYRVLLIEKGTALQALDRKHLDQMVEDIKAMN